MHSSGFFRIKPIARLILKCEILGSHTISDQSLLLSTIVLNDIMPLYIIYAALCMRHPVNLLLHDAQLFRLVRQKVHLQV